MRFSVLPLPLPLLWLLLFPAATKSRIPAGLAVPALPASQSRETVSGAGDVLADGAALPGLHGFGAPNWVLGEGGMQPILLSHGVTESPGPTCIQGGHVRIASSFLPSFPHSSAPPSNLTRRELTVQHLGSALNRFSFPCSFHGGQARPFPEVCASSHVPPQRDRMGHHGGTDSASRGLVGIFPPPSFLLLLGCCIPSHLLHTQVEIRFIERMASQKVSRWF